MKAKPHIVPLGLYVGVFLALVALTALTTAAAYVNLGSLNTFVALTIATIKMLLVVLFFMHVWYSVHLVRIVIAASVLWLAIMLSGTLSDEMTRNWSPVPEGWGPSIAQPNSNPPAAKP